MSSSARESTLAYGVALASLAAAVLFRWLLDPVLGDTLPLTTLFGAVAVSVWLGGYRPALIVAVLGYLACDYLFIVPRGQHGLNEPRNLIGLFLYLCSTSIVVGFGEALRRARQRYQVGEEAASQQAERLRTTLASIGDGVITTDLGGRVTDMNAVAEALTGWSNKEAAGVSLTQVFRIVNTSTRLEVENPVLRALKQGVIVGLGNHTVLVAQDGTERPIDDSASPIRSASGEVVGCVLVFRDVTDREKLEAESERQRRLYETVLTNTPDLAYVFDLNHRFTYANHALLTMWGRAWKESIGKTCLELGYEPWHAALHDREIEQVVATKQPIRGEVAFDGTNGRRQYDYIFVPVIGADGEVEAVAGTSRDVSERRQTEDQLRRNHDTFFALIQNNPFGVYAVDADFRLRQVSLGAQKVFETVRPLLGRDFAEVLRTLWPEPFASEAIGRFRHTLDTGEAYSAPSTVERRADIGAVETYDWRIERISLPDGRYGVVCYFYDLSERQRWESTLRDSEERLRLATNAAELGIWTWEPEQDVVVWENDRPFEIFGLPRSEPPVTAARFKADFLHPEDTETFDIAFARAERMRVPLLCECRIRRTDGETRWVEFTGRVVEGEENVRLIGTVQDITDRKRIEEELRWLASELQDAHRRKDEFLATLAHELRNPLAPIRNGLQVMQLAGANGSIERARSMMERQLKQLVRLVDDLVDMSRVTSGKLQLRREWVELRAVIDAAIETSRPAIDEAQHELAVVVPDEPIVIHGDATRLAQVVSNLLNNSAKYTPRGGRVRLAARRENGMAVLVVADDGIGIPPAMLGKVFEMFTQVDRALEKTTGGLGIGLSLVKGVVEMHGGTIEARSEGEGRGSEFIVRLPVALSAVQKVEPPAADEPVRSSSRRRILVADDNVDAAESLRELLEWLGNEVRTANDGLQAVDVAETFRPDVILLDIGMPKLSGHEACLRIREQPWGKNAILVAMTGWGQDEDKRRSQDVGFDHHLVKPVDPRALEKLWAQSKAEEA